ncbi:MBL fold metallo-hydrolase [Desulfosarcina ovata]|uniref:Metal-dependent hydrolase n=2 Tax=Desulfosarcina ovata TaxID=83564 RepID=A0A5K8A632_9BACT|nr:MBL fold metallo-hydrolase [Desulfosarcina ovata]BBO80718.1 metal-dependent hydrolase [Desulfosarcina ovata subsp. sediminis]BBO87929.1 metal-dependent hydrolase [Desulfosarcina ovata subsp. ovata]
MSVEPIEHIKWLGHDGFEFTADGVVLVIDPFQVADAPKADIILITHVHHDHCSPDDIARLVKPATVIVTEAESAEKLAGLCDDIRVVTPGDRLTVAGIPIEVVPAYNTDKNFHPKAKSWLGFIVTIDGTRIYHAGDTDLIPEMKSLNVDIALLPVSGTYVMTADEAAAAARLIDPKTVIPMHYDAIVGSKADARALEAALGDRMRVVILEKS